MSRSSRSSLAAPRRSSQSRRPWDTSIQSWWPAPLVIGLVLGLLMGSCVPRLPYATAAVDPEATPAPAPVTDPFAIPAEVSLSHQAYITCGQQQPVGVMELWAKADDPPGYASVIAVREMGGKVLAVIMFGPTPADVVASHLQYADVRDAAGAHHFTDFQALSAAFPGPCSIFHMSPKGPQT